MRRVWLAVLLLVCALAAPNANAAVGVAQSRVALVIGNGGYANTAPLANPVNDAEDVAQALTAAGFKVTLIRNAAKRQFDQALAQFARDAQGADAALFYFAGHGLQFEGRNYVMPVDAELRDQISLRYEMVGVEDVKEALEASSGVKIMVLDSCRDNPLANQLVRSISSRSRDVPMLHGLAPAEPTQGMVIVYATQSGQLALDGAGRNSPFAKAFVEELAAPGLEVAALFRNVEHKVVAATGGRQSPELSISGVPDYYLTAAPVDGKAWDDIHDSHDVAALKDFLARFPDSARASEAKARLAAIEAQHNADAQAPSTTVDNVETLYWQTAMKYDRISDYLSYLKRYPNGAFAPLALDRIAVLSAAPATNPAPEPPPAAATTGALDAAAWRSAESADTVPAYLDYLERFPTGAFTSQAFRRIAALQVKSAPETSPPAAPSPTPKAVELAPEPPPKPAPTSAPARPAVTIVKPPAPRETHTPRPKPEKTLAQPAQREPATPEPSDDRCPPHYFSHVFPSASGFRCMPYQ